MSRRSFRAFSGTTRELRPPLRVEFVRALRWRCPRCGEGRLFVGVFRVPNKCAVCGLPYYRESGYFVGAMYLDFILTAVVWMAAYAAAFFFWGVSFLSEGTRSALWIVFGAAVCLGLMRHSYSVWLCADYWLTPWTPEDVPDDFDPQAHSRAARARRSNRPF